MKATRTLARFVTLMVLVLIASARASVTSVTPIITGPILLPDPGAGTRVSENGVVFCQVPGVTFCVWSEATGTVNLPSMPIDMNDSGMVVGSAPVGSFTQAWIWTPANGLEYIGTLGGITSSARAVNNYGQVVGSSRTSTGATRAFIWSRDLGMQNLGTLHDTSDAQDINDNGTVVGMSVAPDGWFHAFRWTSTEGMTQIGPQGSVAWTINSNGTVAGWIDVSGGSNRTAFIWDQVGGLVTLADTFQTPRLSDSGVVAGTTLLSGATSAWAWTASTGTLPVGLGGSTTLILGMNDAGMLVGQGRPAGSTQTRAWVWTPGGGTINLGTFGGTFSGAWGVNNNGVVVGQSSTSSGAAQAFAWTAETGMVSLGPQIALGVAINDGGMIVGQSRLAGVDYGTRWTISFQPSNIATTPIGSNVQVQPTATLPNGSTANVSIAFDSVTGGGATTVETSTSGPPPPNGFRLGQPPIYYDVTTNATFIGGVTLCFTWPEGALHNEDNARLLHFENAAWVDVTTSINTTTNTACGRVTSLSPFAVAELSYEFLGFGTPLLPDGSASIQQNKAGRTIPVKFQLKFGGQITGAATATIAVFRLLNVATGTVDTTDLTEDAGAANENSDRFRYDTAAQQYIYNLNTKGWSAPATYRILVTLDDGSTFTVDFSLR